MSYPFSSLLFQDNGTNYRKILKEVMNLFSYFLDNCVNLSFSFIVTHIEYIAYSNSK